MPPKVELLAIGRNQRVTHDAPAPFVKPVAAISGRNALVTRRVGRFEVVFSPVGISDFNIKLIKAFRCQLTYFEIPIVLPGLARSEIPIRIVKVGCAAVKNPGEADRRNTVGFEISHLPVQVRHGWVNRVYTNRTFRWGLAIVTATIVVGIGAGHRKAENQEDECDFEKCFHRIWGGVVCQWTIVRSGPGWPTGDSRPTQNSKIRVSRPRETSKV